MNCLRRDIFPTNKKAFLNFFRKAFKYKPGNVLLFRAVIPQSTIGSEGLNCRVRDGNGCGPFDKIARKF